ncbi:MAG TPA: hypothetical protein VFF20_00400 [Pseudogracilibacillus sp.]|nr:hypothetical protein [Pseudogracilibacillus sp.]
MRINGLLIVATLCFVGGLFWGLMYEPVKKEPQQVLESEIIEVEAFATEEGEREIVQIEPVEDHPIEKAATRFEKVTSYFFEKIIGLLYALAELWF